MNKYEEDKKLLEHGILKDYFEKELLIKIHHNRIEEYDNGDELQIYIDNEDLTFWKMVDISDFLHTTDMQITVDGDYNICLYCKNWDFSNLESYKRLFND